MEIDSSNETEVLAYANCISHVAIQHPLNYWERQGWVIGNLVAYIRQVICVLLV